MKLRSIGALAVAALFSVTALAEGAHKGKGPKTEAACTKAHGTWDAAANGGKGQCMMGAKKGGAATTTKSTDAGAPAGATGETAPPPAE